MSSVVADALAPSAETAVLNPPLADPSALPVKKKIDWSVNRTLVTRTCLITVWAWALGRFGFSSLWVAAAALLVVFSIVRQRKRVQFFQTLRFQKAMHDPIALQHSLPLIPPWISFPDIERADFIGTLCAQMWPHLKEASEAVVMTVVPPIMDKLKPPPLTSLTFLKLDLGNIPPSIPGVKLQSQSWEEGEVTLDLEVEFAGNPQIVVEARSGPAPVQVSIADFFFRSTIRAVLKPLLYEIPCFGAVSISFVTKPEINFKLHTLGVSVLSIPGLNEALYDLIKSQIAAFVVWPKKIVVPIKKLSADVMAQLNTAECQGVLHVKVRGAKEIKPGDTYAKVSLGAQKKKTSLKKHSGSVEWREEFDFLVHDADNDELSVELKSKENVLLNTVNTLVINHIKNTSSTALGDITIPLNRFTADAKANVPQDLWLTLHHQHKGRTGQVHLEITWSPFIERKVDEAAAGADETVGTAPHLLRRATRSRMTSGTGGGLVVVMVHSAAGLKRPSGHTANSPYIVLTIGDRTARTPAGHHGSGDTVKWEQQFDLSVADWRTAVLRLEVRDKQSHIAFNLGLVKDAVLGELVLPVAKMQKDGRKTETLPLQKTQSGTITITTELKET